ncbi:uncharacterized protein LOC112054702 [Bicyclus anynana]|uniref:Uncharacterized protein LOC112054702 n=1 Tax=Bicyclus anynana TaxID=110368 RepID=A0ABM3LMX5_BICAN|nr:uncharacterized protein LOC112054702 [Bicyclus anynana]
MTLSFFECAAGTIELKDVFTSKNADQSQSSWQRAVGKETVLAALARLEQDIANSEKLYPAQRLTVVAAELETIQQEIKEFEEITVPMTNAESYSKTMHQLFVNLDLYKRPMLAAENEDFVANVNRKEMRRLELSWLRSREKELQRDKRQLHAQLLRIRSLYSQLQQLLGAIWSDGQRPDVSLEEEFERVHSLRDGLANVSMRLKAAVEYAHSALRLLDDALPAWKLASIGKSGWERTAACGDACKLLVRARCQERGARRVLAASAAPRAARALRLALDYAFTDTVHDHKYQRATEIFLQFKESLVQLVNSIHQVLLNNVENLAFTEKELEESRRKLRSARANDIVKRGLHDLEYDMDTLERLKGSTKVVDK